ncbi:PAS domain-containing protein [Chloracidobacterium validum]|uniref:histidine kinase n=1 Tax=Chloracidobacterium validum TaxID=2821543 RepID=A0ABX8B8H3_9BACT|nr:PAS domain-containing protein [Chloracidobacterium validum]QUW03183.1 PAS domain-containing protein [Chloracidobacterium validum]
MEQKSLPSDWLESILQAVINLTPGALCYHDPDFRLRFFNESYAQFFERLSGRRPQIGERLSDWLVNPDLQKQVETNWRQARRDLPYKGSYEINFGQEAQTCEIHWQPVRDADGTVIGTLAWGRDVAAQKQNQDALQLLRFVLEQMQDMVLITEAWPIDAAEGGPRIVYVNEAFERATGYTRAEVIGQTPRILQGPKTQRDRLDQLRSALERWEPVRVELVNYRKDGQEFIADISISPFADASGRVLYWVVLQRDVTREKAMIAILNDALEERSVLLKEVHHRVKNNLQTVLSLLELHAAEPNGHNLAPLLPRVQSRIRAIALIHEQLYIQQDFSRIQLDELLSSLTANIQTIFADSAIQVTLHPSQLGIPLDLAVPVALIAHELLTNAFKHGAAAGARTIGIQLHQSADTVTLEVIDDGTCHPSDVKDRLRSSKRLGLRLVDLLTRQIAGTIAFDPQPGQFRAALAFPLTKTQL